MERRAFGVWIEEHYRTVLTVGIAALVTLAWYHRFMQDDAFISFRYAENLLRGYGLVWNPGERVEGYSNFLWTLMIAGGMYFGFDPVPWSQLLGLVSFMFSLWLTFRIAWSCFGSRFIACMTVFLLGWNFTFHSFATGGLETQFQTFLFLAMIYGFVRMKNGEEPTGRWLLFFSLASACAIMTRLDSLIISGLFGGYLAFQILRLEKDKRRRHFHLFVLILPQIGVLVPWIVWKQWYYGGILPNPFYLKTVSAFSGYFLHGLRYIVLFLISYGWIPICVVGLIAIRRWLRENNTFFLISSVGILLWVCYIISVGGDFMEFRMLVPIMPLMFLLVSWTVFVYFRSVVLQLVFIVLLLAGSVYHERSFTYDKNDGIEPISQLQGHLTGDLEDWIGIGRMLDSLFADNRSVRIATTAAGVIPFYSKLPTIDMLGVNDPWTIRNGIPVSSMVGHQVVAPLSYLLRKRVNLVFSHPLVLPETETIRYRLLVPIDVRLPSDSISVLELPLPGNRKVIVWYLTREKFIDTLLNEVGWSNYSLASLMK